MMLDAGSSAEVVVNIGNMMAGFFNHFSKALNTAANYKANESKQDTDQVQNSFMPPHICEIYNMRTGTINLVQRFDSLNPPTFDGLAGPEAAEDWMKRINEICELIIAPKNLCISLARKMLTGSALVWFDQNKIENLRDIRQFTRCFLKVYSPVAFKRVCEQKVRLLQGERSVQEYREVYESDAVNFMSDEIDRMHFFYMGLKPIYRRIVGETMLNSYKELVEFTFILEKILIELNQGRVVNLENYFTKNERFRYYLECSEELMRTGCFFCGSVQHCRKQCPSQYNKVPIRGNINVVTKIKKKMKVKNLEYCYHCKSIGHYLRKCPLREMQRVGKNVVKKKNGDSLQNTDKYKSVSKSSGKKGGELSLAGCFSCGSKEHKRNKCPLSQSRRDELAVQNLSKSLQNNNNKLRSVPESSEDKGLGCFGCGSEEHKLNNCPRPQVREQKQNVQNLSNTLQTNNNNNKMLKCVSESPEKKGVESNLSCFFCGSTEHRRNECPGRKRKVCAREYYKNIKKYKSTAESSGDKSGGSVDSLLISKSKNLESLGDTVGESRLGGFGCENRERRKNESPLIQNKVSNPTVEDHKESFQNNNSIKSSKSVLGSGDSLQNMSSSILQTSGVKGGKFKPQHCFGCWSKEHIRRDCPVLESKRQIQRENNLKRKRANESAVIDVADCKARI